MVSFDKNVTCFEGSCLVKSFQHSSERQNLRPLEEEEHGEAKIECKYRCDGWPNEKCHGRKIYALGSGDAEGAAKKFD